jgi:hypothetical protein
MIAELQALDPVLIAHESTGQFAVFRPSGSLMVTVGTGALSLEMAERFVSFLDPLVQEKPAEIDFFHDWWEVGSVDSRARQRVVQWSKARDRGFSRQSHVLIDSSLIAMGIAASSMILRTFGVDVRSYSKRPDFETTLRAAMRSAR